MSLYDVLGLDRGASDAEVRRAYRRLARRLHPGLNPGDHEAAARYAELTRAFETLSDPARRRAYDERGETGTAQEAPDVAFSGFDFSVTVDGGSASTFGDLFVDVFRAAAGDRPAPVAAAGADVLVDVTLSLADVLHGGSRTVQVARRVGCDPCRGAGRIERPPVRCASCHGAGQLRLARGHMQFVRPCGTCAGSGVVRHWPCQACQGRGVQMRVDHLEVQLPPGLADGDEWYLRGQGHAGEAGGPPGQLRVKVSVAADGRWRRVGDDLHVSLPVAVHEAVLGARIDLETPDGAVRLRVPPGTQGGQRLRLRGQGVPSRRTGERGDIVVTVQLVLPRVLDARGRALMAEFARLHPDDVRKDFDGHHA